MNTTDLSSERDQPTTRRRRFSCWIFAGLFVVAGAHAAEANTAVPDAYTALSGEQLLVEDPGVLENDHDGSGGELPPSATAVLVSGVSHGVLNLNLNGSFDYMPADGYFGPDSFSYHIVDGAAVSNTATVSLTVDGCSAGVLPTQTVCWMEQAYLARIASLGLGAVYEGFEDDLAWGGTRTPDNLPSVTSQGLTWASNHPANDITTGGPTARTGSWAFYSDPHGDTSGAPTSLLRDGFTGTGPGGDTLFAVGGWLKGQVGGRVNIQITLAGGGSTVLDFPDNRLGFLHQFFGVIDTAGFETFEVFEKEGTVEQFLFVFGDDFTIATSSGGDTVAPQVVLVNSVADTGDGALSEGEATSAAITELVVHFSEPVIDLGGDSDPHDVTNPANYLLVDENGNGFQTVDCAGGVAGNDVPIMVNSVTYTTGSPVEADLTVNGGAPLPVGSYRLLVCGTTSIRDWADNPLDGDGNGAGGDDFARNFSVVLPPTPTNTPIPPTPTNTPVPPTPTNTPIPPTPTNTPVPPTPTNTPVLPTPTPTSTPVLPTPTPTNTPVVPTPTPTPTGTPVPPSVLTIGDASITEGDAGSASVDITITLAPASGSPVSVDYATGGGTATPGSDYTTASGTADIPAGSTTAAVPLTVLGDLIDEPDESFGVELSNPVGAALGTPSTGTVTIFDDDPMPDLSGADVVVPESAGQALVELTLSTASDYEVSVDYATADGTATAPQDYGAVSGTAFIVAGTLSTSVAVPIVDDVDAEGDENFTLGLMAPSHAVLLTPSVTVTIEDNEGNLIFEDGFEGGDFGAWSAVVP